MNPLFTLYFNEILLGATFTGQVGAVKAQFPATYNFWFFKYLGNYWYETQDYQKAEENYKKALSFTDKNLHAEIYFKLAQLIKVCNFSHRIDEAIEYCKHSILLRPNNSLPARLLLIYFTLEVTSIDELPKKLKGLEEELKITKKNIIYVLNKYPSLANKLVKKKYI